MNESALLAELAEIADELEELAARSERLYERRLVLWQYGRVQDPPLTQLAMGQASRVGEGAVAQALRKHRRQNGASSGVAR